MHPSRTRKIIKRNSVNNRTNYRNRQKNRRMKTISWRSRVVWLARVNVLLSQSRRISWRRSNQMVTSRARTNFTSIAMETLSLPMNTANVNVCWPIRNKWTTTLSNTSSNASTKIKNMTILSKKREGKFRDVNVRPCVSSIVVHNE